jgi:hypothetical protein
MLSTITSFLNEEDHKAFIDLSSKDLSHSFIIHALETSKNAFSRPHSLQIVRSADLIKKIEEKYGNRQIYPVTLTFHQDDVPSLLELEVFRFIRRVQTVVLEGEEPMVIEAKHSESGTSEPQWGLYIYGMYHPNFLAWNQPSSLRDVLQSHPVKEVKTLELWEETADLVIELSGSVSAGDMSWTVTKTSRLHKVQRAGISAEEILMNHKLTNIQTLTLTEFDRSVLLDVSVLAQLENLESLNLTLTDFVDISALAQLTQLKSLHLSGAGVVDVSALAQLTSLESLNLSGTRVVDVSALAQLTNLKSLNLSGTRVVDLSALENLINLKLDFHWTEEY